MDSKENKSIPPSMNTSVEHERLNSLISSMGDGVIALDEMQKIVTYNGAALSILDLNSSMTGKFLSQVLNIVDKDNQKVDVTALVNSATTPLYNRDNCIV